MQLILNGEPYEFEGETLAALIEKLGLGNRRLAAEVNHEIVPRGQHAEHRLHDGDAVEIVHAIGGG